MLQQLIWWSCAALELLLLVQGARTHLFGKFVFFYVYIACVLTKDLVSSPLYTHYPSLYASFYWIAECLLAAISYGVLTEIYGRSLKHYSGAAKFFRILLFVMFFAIVTQVGIGSLIAAPSSTLRAIAVLELDLRQLQAVLLISLLGLLAYYKIPLTRNLRGLVAGYALFVSVDVISVTFVSHPATGFAALMRNIEPLSFLLALVIWSVSLWAPSPELVTQIPSRMEDDYERLVRETRMIILRARTHLVRAGRP